ncbi:hypothetical protein OIO90_000263 [Microbotryomycetes sp. JL221]|nr:hypothetical protein OIO90_000263 [Microbotryomycetes sp. JL221]
MTSVRTRTTTAGTSYLAPQPSYLSPALSAPTERKSKYRKDRGSNVLPSSSSGYDPANSSTAHLAPRIRESLADAKARRRERRGVDGGISKSNMLVDNDGIAHDSEYVQFRTATPAHVHARRAQMSQQNGDDDESASSASSSSTEGEDPDHPRYAYQSITRSPPSSAHHHYVATLGTTASAVPGYLAPRPLYTSLEKGPTSLLAPRAPSPRRASGEYEKPGSLLSGVSGHYGGRTMSGYQLAASRAGQTTASFQPPAPAFNPRSPDPYAGTSLRIPPSHGSDTDSLAQSAARMSLGAEAANMTSNSGYNTYVTRQQRERDEKSIRQPKLDGTALQAGMHGTKRSMDAFKLEMKFGAHKIGSKMKRKINSAIG